MMLQKEKALSISGHQPATEQIKSCPTLPELPGVVNQNLTETDVQKSLERLEKAEKRVQDFSRQFLEDEGQAESTIQNPFLTALQSSVTLKKFREMELPERPWLIEPLIRAGQIAMIYAKAGVGKTWFALQLALGLTRSGKIFGPFVSSGTYRVFYLDAEMSAREMQDRINSLAIQHDPEQFVLCSSELLAMQEQVIPNLTDSKWLEALKTYLKSKNFDVFVIDNLSSLTPGQDELKRIDWDMVNQWLIGLRRLGITTIIIHHAGKNGDQRGTSSREDQLDLSIRLEKLENRELTAFQVKFAKSRGLSGEQKKPFIVELRGDSEGKIIFQHKSINDDILAQIIFMASQGATQKEIAGTINLNQSSVSRRINRALRDGLLIKNGNSYELTELGKGMTAGLSEGDF
jgi:putative DNA primase/helicase